MQILNKYIRKYRAVFLLILLTACLSGCGLRYVTVKDLDKLNSPRLIDPNTSPFKIIRLKNDPNQLLIINNTKIIHEKPCRVNYKRLNFDLMKHVVINAQFPNGRTYPVIIDSGCTPYDLLISPLIVRKNKLDTLFSPPEIDPKTASLQEQRGHGGLCYLPSLHINELEIHNPRCVFVPWRMEWHILGIPVWQNEQIIMGASLMSKFRYLYFDNVNRQLELSKNDSFLPPDPGQWASYPMRLGKDHLILVDIPIGGVNCTISFDTGGAGIYLKREVWEKIQPYIDNSAPQKSRFLSFQYGNLPCEKSVIKKLKLGNVMLKKAPVAILPDDSIYLSESTNPGIISIWEFKDTSVVLDFEHRLMWIKNL